MSTDLSRPASREVAAATTAPSQGDLSGTEWTATTFTVAEALALLSPADRLPGVEVCAVLDDGDGKVRRLGTALVRRRTAWRATSAAVQVLHLVQHLTRRADDKLIPGPWQLDSLVRHDFAGAPSRRERTEAQGSAPAAHQAHGAGSERAVPSPTRVDGFTYLPAGARSFLSSTVAHPTYFQSMPWRMTRGDRVHHEVSAIRLDESTVAVAVARRLDGRPDLPWEVVELKAALAVSRTALPASARAHQIGGAR